MPFEQEEATGAQLLQQERCVRFAPQAADRIRAAENCLFSLLPHDELSRLAGEWYEACAQGMMRGNYSPIDRWIRSQSELAAQQGFSPEDLFQLLLICRRSAIEVEGWNEDIFSNVDEVINEVFRSVRRNSPWNIPDEVNYQAAAEPETPAPAPVVEVVERKGERRRFARNRLRFPIRVISSGFQASEDITQTQSVSRGGLYFLTWKEYQYDQPLKVNFPYWSENRGINREYAAKIVRIDRMPDQTWGVGVDFLESLGRAQDSTSPEVETV